MAFSTWNPSDKTANVTLSGGDLVATATGAAAHNGVRGTDFKSSGQYYCEVTVTNEAGAVGTAPRLGISTSSWPFDNSYPSDSYFTYFKSGSKGINDSSIAYGDSFTDGDIISIVLDLDAGTLHFWKNGVDQGEAFSGLSGSFAPTFHDIGGSVVTANFGGSAFTYTPPGGYVGWSDVSYLLAADSGSFAVTGTAASFLVDYVFDAEAGSFAVTGTDATLTEDGFLFSAEPGSYVVTGTDATLTHVSNTPIIASFEAMTGEIVAVQGTTTVLAVQMLPATALFQTVSNVSSSLDGAMPALQGLFHAPLPFQASLPALTGAFVNKTGTLAQLVARLRPLAGAFVATPEGLAELAARMRAPTGAFSASQLSPSEIEAATRALRGAFAASGGSVAYVSASMLPAAAALASQATALAEIDAALPFLRGAFSSEAAVGSAMETWVTNTRTGGVTRYPSYPANSLARYNGTYLSASGTGLYLLQGATEEDDGEPVEWAVRTGAMDDKRPNLKRVTEILLGVRYDEPIRAFVWKNEETEYEYPLASYQPGLLHQARVLPGKGLRSRYFKVGLVGSGKFELDSMQVTMPNTTRRMG